MKLFFLITLSIFSIASCMPSNQYQKKYFFASHQWLYADAKTFDFEIKDTSVKYNLQFLMQHTDAYANSNIWLKMITKYPNGIIDSQRIEVPLALPSGRWLGTIANNNVEHTMNIAPNAASMRFLEKGKYQITLIQNMRKDTLLYIDYIGLQVDKVATNKY